MSAELELHKIKRSMHHEIILSFREMMDEISQRELTDELKAKYSKWERQWTRMTTKNSERT